MTDGPGNGKEQLVGFLTLDFTTDEDRARLASDNALTRFRAIAIPIGQLEERMLLTENINLGLQVQEVLEPAPVTESFKNFITNAVRHAHAIQRPVDEAVSPDRLGLLNSEGIFNPTQAKTIEAQTLRGHLFDLISKYMIELPGEYDTDPMELMIFPGIDAKRVVEALNFKEEWTKDYKLRYGEDPFEGIEKAAFLDAAIKPVVLSEEESRQLGFSGLIAKLKRRHGA